MIRRRRTPGSAAADDLPSQAQAAVRSLAEGGPRRSGGLTGFVARALRRRRPAAPAVEMEAGMAAADDAELSALREELTRELERAASRQAGDEAASEPVHEPREATGLAG